MLNANGDNQSLTSEAFRPYTFSMDQEKITDEALMLMYKNGDAGAFEQLYGRHKGPVYRYVVRQCQDRSIAEELFQDIWMKIIQHRLNYQAKSTFKTYIYTIARHRVIDHFRKTGNRSFDHEEDIEDGLPARESEQPEQLAALGEQLSRLNSALKSLPDLQREVFLLKEEAGMNLHEIATLTGVNQETVKSRLRYAVKKLRQEIAYG